MGIARSHVGGGRATTTTSPRPWVRGLSILYCPIVPLYSRKIRLSSYGLSIANSPNWLLSLGPQVAKTYGNRVHPLLIPLNQKVSATASCSGMFVLITAFLLSWLFGLEVAMFLLGMPPDVLRGVYPSALIDKSRRSFFGSSCLRDPGEKQSKDLRASKGGRSPLESPGCLDIQYRGLGLPPMTVNLSNQIRAHVVG
jgi:hypothetical protein